MTTHDYTVPILEGAGETDYARYLRTDELLALQKSVADMIHRDELLFQVVHQSTELWLKLACSEVTEATVRMCERNLEGAIGLLARASLGMRLVTDQLEMLRFLAPWDFQLIRTVLGHGAGFESPGWRETRRVSQELHSSFQELIGEEHIDLLALYQSGQGTAAYRLCEKLIDWDERIALWRAGHYKIVTRIIGHDVIGTKGTPVDMLEKLIGQKFFPELWDVRTTLTEVGPMGSNVPLPDSGGTATS